MPERVRWVEYWGGWAWDTTRERTLLRGAVGEFLVDIQHSGRTAVPDLIARPRVDPMLGTRHWPWGHSLDQRLKTIGDELYGVPGGLRRAYQRARQERSHGRDLQTVEVQGSQWTECLLFRKLLLEHPEVGGRRTPTAAGGRTSA